jgi:hypothetical protein
MPQDGRTSEGDGLKLRPTACHEASRVEERWRGGRCWKDRGEKIIKAVLRESPLPCHKRPGPRVPPIMKRLFAFAVVSLSLISIGEAEEELTKFSLIVRWTPPGGEVVETKVPDVALLINDFVQVPVARGAAQPGDPMWNLVIRFELDNQWVSAELTDHSLLQANKDTSLRPVEIASASFALKWNEEIVIFDSGHGKLSFVPGLEGALPEKRKEGSKRLPEDLAEKIEFSHTLTERGNLSFEVYNPTEFSVDQALVRIRVPAAEGRAAFDRVYQINVDWRPFADADAGTGMHVPKLAEYPEGTQVEVTLEKAF